MFKFIFWFIKNIHHITILNKYLELFLYKTWSLKIAYIFRLQNFIKCWHILFVWRQLNNHARENWYELSDAQIICIWQIIIYLNIYYKNVTDQGHTIKRSRFWKYLIILLRKNNLKLLMFKHKNQNLLAKNSGVTIGIVPFFTELVKITCS